MSREYWKVITRFSRMNWRGKRPIASDRPQRSEEDRWRFVAREAALISRCGCDLSRPSLSDEQRAEALEHILRAATRLTQFAESRMKRAASAKQLSESA